MMRKSRLTAFGIVLTAFVVIQHSQQAAAKINCPGDAGTTNLTVNKLDGTVTYKTGHTRSDLQRIQQRHAAEATASGWFPLGLTLSEMRMEMRISTRAFSTAGGRYCSVPDKVDIDLGYSQFTVYIDRRYRRGSCEYRAISEHEDRHVEIYRQQLDRYISWVRERMARAIGRMAPLIVSSPNQGAEQIKRRLSIKLKPLINKLRRATDAANWEIDSRTSYGRVQSRCRNW